MILSRQAGIPAQSSLPVIAGCVLPSQCNIKGPVGPSTSGASFITWSAISRCCLRACRTNSLSKASWDGS